MFRSPQQFSPHFKTMASFMAPVQVFPSPPCVTPSRSSPSPVPVPTVLRKVEKTVRSAPGTTLPRLQESGCKAFHRAVASEQTKSWPKAIENYTELLKIVNKCKTLRMFGNDLLYAQLLFETYYHLAVAYQSLNLHKKATEQLTFAAEIVAIPKNGCDVGCNSEYHTPIFSRRAFSHVICGKKNEAIKDANKAINLDRLNPDVYCIRALVWNSYKETKRAIDDLDKGLRLNPYHVCALIIRGAIINSLNSETENEENNKDHEKAYKICQKSTFFFDVTNFKSPKMAELYEKFLWSLNVPHTITSLNLLKGYSTYFTNLSSTCKFYVVPSLVRKSRDLVSLPLAKDENVSQMFERPMFLATELPDQKISPKLRKFPGMPITSSSQRTTDIHLKKSLTESSNSSIRSFVVLHNKERTQICIFQKI